MHNLCLLCHLKLYSTSDGDDDMSSDQYTSAAPKKKKRIRTNRRLFPFPRIVKRDIRRLYPSMLVNVMNSGDLSILSGFLGEFTTKQCKFVDYFPGNDTVNLSWHRTFEGVSSIMSYFSSFWTPVTQALIPDFSVKIRWASIKQFLNKDNSELMCGISYTASRLFDLTALLQMDAKAAKQAPHKNKSLKDDKSKGKNNLAKKSGTKNVHSSSLYLEPDIFFGEDDSFGYQYESSYPSLSATEASNVLQAAMFFNMIQFLSQPRDVHFDGMVIFRLDEQSRIASMEFGPEVQPRRCAV